MWTPNYSLRPVPNRPPQIGSEAPQIAKVFNLHRNGGGRVHKQARSPSASHQQTNRVSVHLQSLYFQPRCACSFLKCSVYLVWTPFWECQKVPVKRGMQLPWKRPRQLHRLGPAAFNKCFSFSRGASSLWEPFLCFRTFIRCPPHKGFYMPGYFLISHVVHLNDPCKLITNSKQLIQGVTRLFMQCSWIPLSIEGTCYLCQQVPCFSTSGSWTW